MSDRAGGTPMVWTADLDVGPTLVGDLSRLLVPAELERAGRYHSPADRDRFVVGRAIVRTVLAAYVGEAPSRLVLVPGPHGKPRVASATSPTEFSVSRSAGRLLLAVSDSTPVGVDIEIIDPRIDMDRIAARYFSAAERRALGELGPQDRLRASYACWTRKEAYLKGVGVGIGLGLDGFSVSVQPSGPVVLDGSFPSADIVRRWSLVGLDVGPGAAAALAVERGVTVGLDGLTPMRLEPPYHVS